MKKVFDPEWGNPSLRNIVEAEFPEPVSLMPSTPGWWILLFVVIALFARALWRKRQRYLRDRYRREALAQLAAIKQRLAAGALEAVRELAPLLRATAIAAMLRPLSIYRAMSRSAKVRFHSSNLLRAKRSISPRTELSDCDCSEFRAFGVVSIS